MPRAFAPVRSRLFRPAKRSSRRPWFPGCPIPACRLRGVRYGDIVRRDLAIRRGWMVREFNGPFLPGERSWSGSVFSGT